MIWSFVLAVVGIAGNYLVGNDGLTAAERKEYADRYAEGPGRGLDDKGRDSLRRLRERYNAQR